MFSCEIGEIFKNTFVAAFATETWIEHDDYLQQLSNGGLTTPSIALRDFIFQTFTIIDFI